MSNTLVFPTVSPGSISDVYHSPPAEPPASSLSLIHHISALEICDLVYGPATPPSWEAIERFYEPSATYENPFITATSRSVIADIHTLASHLAKVDVPRPVAVLHALFRLKRGSWSDPWFRAIRVWTEVGDVCESESFDGHRKTIVEHTINILFLPGLHSSASQPQPIHHSPTHSNASRELSLSLMSANTHQTNPNNMLGLNLTLPSPLHLRLPIITRLSFNDVGRITHHRDFWDVKDLLGLVPGMTLFQWIATRLVAQGIRGVVGLGRSLLGSQPAVDVTGTTRGEEDQEKLTPAAAYAKSVKHSAHATPDLII